MIYKKPDHDLPDSQIRLVSSTLMFCLITILSIFFMIPVASGEVNRQMRYGNYAEDDQMKKERLAFEKTTKGEHPLARMERLAHGYAYGKGSDEGWNDKKLRRRMNVDGFNIVETMINKDDGTASMVIKDRKTGRHIIVFRGTDSPPDYISDAKETTLAQIGQTQYAANKAIFNEWAEKYSKDGKLDVTGHSLGGGLAHIFTSVHGDKIKKVATFQAPAQEKSTIDRYNKIPVEKRPEQVVLMVAAPDPVAHVGTKHAGVTKVIAGSADDMTIGHTNMLLQKKGVKDWQGNPSRSSDDNLLLQEMTPEEYMRNREPNILGTHDTWSEWYNKAQRMRYSQWREKIKKQGLSPAALAKIARKRQIAKKNQATPAKPKTIAIKQKANTSKKIEDPIDWVETDVSEPVFEPLPDTISGAQAPCEEEFITIKGKDGGVTIIENENFDPMCDNSSQEDTSSSNCDKPLAATVDAINNRLAESTPSEVASLSFKLLPEKEYKRFMNCLCAATSTKSSNVSKYYEPKPVDASPSCNDTGNGACVNQGFGCTRHPLKITIEALESCNAGYWVVKQLCED